MLPIQADNVGEQCTFAGPRSRRGTRIPLLRRTSPCQLRMRSIQYAHERSLTWRTLFSPGLSGSRHTRLLRQESLSDVWADADYGEEGV